MKNLRFDLKRALTTFEARTGQRLTYDELSNVTGISVDTLKSLASRPNYNATLHIIAQIANSLNINPIECFDWVIDKKSNEDKQ